MRTLIVSAAAALAACCFLACGSSTPTPSAPAAGSTAAAADLKPNGEAKVGDRTKCPVTGEAFVVKDTSPKVEYEGKTYYFCCAGCDENFKKDPKKFLAK